MDTKSTSEWMLDKLEKEGCIYQDDVVDILVRSKCENLLKENADGNLVLGIPVLNAFKKLTIDNVVWVKPDRYWRFRVKEDELGRNARG
ncbi:DUF6953 family protein [Moritella viscosa]|uniref:Uncharacterized protein n=1 Tax=Moritella viscosa TaxID=80854 RepID=A0A1L0F5N7_9GAMM|nr:hypothetical protein [Moritella viscosa]SGZ17477.1 Putative uncharacterized protein [Moritella viscosa]